MSRRGFRFALVAVVAGLGLALLYVVAVVPPTEDTWYPKCTFHRTTGLHCPGCGLTRSAHAALNGRFLQSLVYNATAPVVFPMLAYAILSSLWAWAKQERTPYKPGKVWHRYAWYAFGIFVVIYGIIRNLPFEPFTTLAPHELPP
jgi:hypothetical protein